MDILSNPCSVWDQSRMGSGNINNSNNFLHFPLDPTDNSPEQRFSRHARDQISQNINNFRIANIEF